jgi:PPK2 family polyphosphate:nucleotide phosphotransferase
MKSPKIKSPYLIHPHTHVRLAHLPVEVSGGPGYKKTEEASLPVLVKHREKLAKLQEVFYASQTHGLLIVLQGMDTAGKDGTISHIFSGINPQGCDVTSFKTPTPLESKHDFLWRAHNAVPPVGMFGIFNRSHYEDVLYPVVHGTVSHKEARERFEQINEFESTLAANRVVILKFFLHISFDEQTRRMQSRIDDPDKHWKLSPADFAERKFWPKYEAAYNDLLSATSCKHAPWLVIPSNCKWQRDLAISEILVDVLDRLKLKYPAPVMKPAEMNSKKLQVGDCRLSGRIAGCCRAVCNSQPAIGNFPHPAISTTAPTATAIPRPCRRVGRSPSIPAASRIVEAG